MADNIWQDVDENWTNVANWSQGSAPAITEDIYFLTGSQTIDTNLPASGAGIDYNSLNVGPNFAGKIGTTTNKLYIGDVGTLYFNGARCQECWLGVDGGGDALARTFVDSSGPGTNALHLFSGEFTNVHIRGGQSARVGAGATVTNLYGTGNGRCVIEASATLTNAYIAAGSYDNYAAVATLLRVYGGTWNHVGTTTFNIATLDQGGGLFRFNSKGGTITTANLFGGKLDGSGGFGTPRIITTLNQYGGVYDSSGTGSSITVTNYNEWGGEERRVPSPPTS